MFKRWLYVATTAYILVFFSELFFYGAESLRGFLVTWFFYALVIYLILGTIAHYRINTIWTLFLAGALYGWLIEGVIVQTTYENLPFSISDTGLSWHALISVWVGWYGVRRALLEPKPYKILLWSIGIGLFWGFWMPFWGFELLPNMPPPTLESMTLLAATAVPPLILSYWLQNRLKFRTFTPHKIEMGAIIVLLLIQFIFTIIPSYPIALIVLPLLLLFVFWGLRRHRQTTTETESYITGLSGQIRPLNLLSLLIIIPTTLFAFWLDQALGLTPYPQYFIFTVTVLAGFLCFFIALFRIWRRPQISLISLFNPR